MVERKKTREQSDKRIFSIKDITHKILKWNEKKKKKIIGNFTILCPLYNTVTAFCLQSQIYIDIKNNTTYKTGFLEGIYCVT